MMVDMPGHGESSFDPNGDYTAHGMADFLDQVRTGRGTGWEGGWMVGAGWIVGSVKGVMGIFELLWGEKT